MNRILQDSPRQTDFAAEAPLVITIEVHEVIVYPSRRQNYSLLCGPQSAVMSTVRDVKWLLLDMRPLGMSVRSANIAPSLSRI